MLLFELKSKNEFNYKQVRANIKKMINVMMTDT